MKFTKIGEIAKGQDGAIWNQLLFRFDAKGNCHVCELDTLEETAQFQLDGTDEWMPHSNAVMFGCEYFAEGDEFPLLYTNVYNTYSKEDDRREGVCCVYRITRQGNWCLYLQGEDIFSGGISGRHRISACAAYH